MKITDGSCALQLPRNYAIMNAEEMTYVDGGVSFAIYGTTGRIKSDLTTVIAAGVAGNIATPALGFALGGITGAVIGRAAGSSWFGAILRYARPAHNKVEGYIAKYGKNKMCKMVSTWSTVFCTGISVSL